MDNLNNDNNQAKIDVSNVTSSSAILSDANLCRHLASAAKLTPNNLAVSVQRYRGFNRNALNANVNKLFYDELSFAQLHQQSDAIAHALLAYGIKRGMKAVLMVTPSIDFFSLTFALFKAGIVPILVDPGMGVKNLKQCFAESAPDVFIGIPKAHIARKLFGWGKNSVKLLLTVGGSNTLATIIGGLTLNRLLKKHPSVEPFPMATLSDDEISAILFTSGSTGTPKGVVYSHKMFEAQISALKNDYGIVAGERDLATFPLFSLFGPALGMASIIPDMDASKPIKANPAFIFAAIEKYQCTNLFANPALIEVLGQAGSKANGQPHQLLSLKRVISAGAPATLSSIKRFIPLLSSHVEVLTSYGATESLPLTQIGSNELLTTTDITDNGGGICVGRAIDGVEISIIAITDDVIDTWHDDLALPKNTIGEIVVSGDMVSHSYYQRDTATEQAKIYSHVAGTNKQEHHKTTVRHRMGDLGYQDSQGRLWMCGRKAHRVDTPNKQYFSIPCERIFNTHDDVKRTALVSVTLLGAKTPLLCIELTSKGKKISAQAQQQLFSDLFAIALKHPQTKGIKHFLIHPDFPVDIRHNAKIFREKLALWAQTHYE
ncbi:AMP-binding protein [Colwellia sp. D2M02]|uniref:olefin beta-lactone synthetase n=1 Tax=Colwellia sp. D2M02 TaxID=2841562 RepID=UPI001C0A001E|nr:fatty acid CoA ligase family protein [Colwellia sp. D2M02]MBU2892990.1 AMP-binding protein [Colwellia sp. D2M02]